MAEGTNARSGRLNHPSAIVINKMKPCPFCSLPQSRVIDSSPLGLVIRDGFPISPGHTLIIPKRHVGSFFELEADKRA